jgi:hypothetical protein
LPDKEWLKQKINHGGRMHDQQDKKSHYRKDSLTLVGAVALDTGVLIGATTLSILAFIK